MSDANATSEAKRTGRKRWLTVAAGLVVLLCWQVYQLGAVRGALDVGERLDDRAELLALQDRSFVIIEQQERKIASLSAQLDTQRKLTDLELQAGAELQRELQSSLQERRQLLDQIQFFESIIGNDASQAGLRVAKIKLRPTASSQEWLLELTLTQVKKHTSRQSGKVLISVAGEQDGQPVELALKQMHPKQISSQRFGFRYYQTLSFPLSLPASFIAKELTIDVQVQAPKRLQLAETRGWEELLH